MKDNKKKKDRRKYPQGSAASHAGQNSGNHGGHAGHPCSRSSKLLKNRKTLLMDLVSSKNYEPMRLKDIAMLLQVPKAKRSELAEVMEILVKEAGCPYSFGETYSPYTPYESYRCAGYGGDDTAAGEPPCDTDLCDRVR